MSEKKPLRRRIRDRDLVLGTFIKTANPAVLEILGYAGFDFAVLDCEHSNISYGQIEDSVRTGENVGLPIIVRVASANDQNIFHALDSGAAGVQLPNLSTPEQVAQSVRYAKYYPLGERGLSRSQRAAKFGFWESERPYVDSANEDTVVSVHIENEAMARRAEEICRQEQVDVRHIPRGAVTDLQMLVGNQAAITIPSGSMATHTMFRDGRERLAALDRPVIAGCRAEDLYQLASGTLRGGDRIHIYTVDEELGQAYLVWEDVTVYQAFDSSGNLIPSQDTLSAAARINVLLEEGDAGLFYSELYKGSLRVVKIWE